MRALAVVVGLVVVAGLLALGRVGDLGGMVPWSAGCEVRDEADAVLLDGSPGEVGARVDAALADEPDGPVAQALAAGPALTCRIGPTRSTDTPKEPPLGLTPNAQRFRDEVRATFGDVPDGGFGPQEVLPGRRPGGAHSAGRAIDFFFRPIDDPDQAAAGWQLANWSVANAERLGIRTVIYRDRIWTAWRSAQGWRDYRFAGPDPDNPINRHLDHVHVDVA
jgi:hypothetical protein